MTDHLSGDKAFKVDGVPYTLNYSIDRIIEVEDALDDLIMSILIRLGAGKMRMRELRTLFWFGLKEHHAAEFAHDAASAVEREAGLRKAGQLIPRIDDGEMVAPLIAEAYRRAFPKANSKDTKRPQAEGEAKTPPAVGTGAAS